MTFKLLALIGGRYEFKEYPNEEAADLAYVTMKGKSAKDQPKVKQVPLFVEKQ
jgi:hypothetical protein